MFDFANVKNVHFSNFFFSSLAPKYWLKNFYLEFIKKC